MSTPHPVDNKAQHTKPKRQYNVQPKMKHRQVLEKMVENGGNVSRAMRDVGYSPATAENPKKVTESKGFQQLLEQYLPNDFILEALQSDIKAKPKRRVAELTLASKIKGLIKNEQKEGDKTLILITTPESAQRYRLQSNEDVN